MFVTRTALGLLVATGLGLSSGAQADINVGVILALTGPNSSLGIPYKKGLELLPKEIGGQKVNLLFLDDASDPSQAVRNAQKLISEDKVDLIVGPSNSPAGFAVREVANKAKVLQIAVAPVDAKGADADWLITVPQPASIWAIPIAKDMKARGVKRAGFIGFSDPWGDISKGALETGKTIGGYEIVADERYARADTSVSGQVLKLLAAKPDAILIGGSGTPGTLPHIALAERNFKGPQYATPGVFNPDFLRLGGKALEGVMGVTGPITAGAILPESNPIRKVALNFIEQFKKINDGNPPNGFHAFSYDAVLIIDDIAKRAVKKAQPGTEAFRTALRDEVYNVKELVGVQGIYNFKKGDPYGVDERSIVLMTVRDGKWVLEQK
jgi:branched-chain amino acid transport system substrate-binding protein